MLNKVTHSGLGICAENIDPRRPIDRPGADVLAAPAGLPPAPSDKGAAVNPQDSGFAGVRPGQAAREWPCGPAATWSRILNWPNLQRRSLISCSSATVAALASSNIAEICWANCPRPLRRALDRADALKRFVARTGNFSYTSGDLPNGTRLAFCRAAREIRRRDCRFLRPEGNRPCPVPGSVSNTRDRQTRPRP